MIDFLLSPWTVGSIVTALIGGGIATWFFFPTIAASLIGTKTGRAIIGVIVALAGVLVLLAKVFAAGRAKEQAAQKEQSLKNLRERVKTDDAVQSLPLDERKKRLEQWSQD